MDNEYKNPNDNWYYNHRYNNNYEWNIKGCIYSLIGIVLVALLSLLFQGCKSIQYVPVETVRTEYVTKTDTFLQKDSLVLHDSVYIHSKGDTVWYEKWHTKYKDRIVTKIVVDSFIKTDSIQVPYPVEKKLTRWQQVKMDWGGTAMIILAVFSILIIIAIVDIIRRR
jgi:hypothetical protein